MKRFETIKDIKKRNSKYYYLSNILEKLLNVMDNVELTILIIPYGYLSGPFYCGINILMNMPCFNIRLCSPTSTSKKIEVATKFSGPNGIIIHFNNPNTLQYRYLRGFNVSWLSRYGEEDEV